MYVGDYSPDARTANPNRGPAGHGKWTAIRKPGNYGWPYCATAKLPYTDYDFATKTSGKKFNCAKPVNNSPHNTGKKNLPKVQQPDIWYTYGESAQFPELGTGGIGPMAGPAYDFDARDTRGRNAVAWPKQYDGVPLFYEWTRDYIKGIHANSNGKVTGIEDVVSSIVTDNPMDMEFGPDGALYVLEYGDGYFAENPDAQLSRIDFIGKNGNHSPEPKITATPTSGSSPLVVDFSSAGSTDADGDTLKYAWDFDGDGSVDSRKKNPSFTYTEDGVYKATLTVTDSWRGYKGRHASADVDIVVGNQAPTLTFVSPVAGQPFQFGDTVTYEVTVEDDQPVDCTKVTVSYVLGHDQHGHPQSTAAGCTGTLVTTVPGGHDPDTDDLSAVFVASYTDPGGDGLPPLTGSAEVRLVPNP